jgi:hypothetical protein
MEISKSLYEKQQEQESNRELIAAIKALIPALQKDNDTEILSVLRSQTENIKRLADIKLPTPEVNVSTNQDAVIEAITNMARDIIIGLENLRNLIEEKSKSEWVFSVKRGKYNHLIEEIKASKLGG